MRQHNYIRNVVTLELDEAKCNGCRTCETVCPQGVMQRSGKKARIVDRDACMECGACARNCRAEALSVRAGVGCANAVINGFFGRKDTTCGCVVEPDGTSTGSGGCCC